MVASAVFFASFWLLKIIIVCYKGCSSDTKEGAGFEAFMVGLELVEFDVLPLCPYSNKCCPECLPWEDYTPDLPTDTIKRRFDEHPFKILRAGLEDYGQAIIQLTFCASHDGSSTAWLGVVVSFLF